MKANLSFFVSLIFFISNFVLIGNAQIQLSPNILIKSNDVTGDNVNHTACKEIRLMPGYKYEAQIDKQMHAKIDPYMVCDIDYTGTTFSSQNLPPIDLSLPVGTINGQFNVSHSGAATYTIPIIIPPGTNNMQPNLQLVYNSQSSDGLLGYGWNLSGLSSITRAGKNIYHDEAISSVTITNTDVFLLDGQRLFPLNGNNGGNNIIYGTEVESFTEIKSYTGVNEGPSFFIVKTKDGVIMEYGNTNDSKIEAQYPNNTVFTWLLNKVIDPFGNYYTISYIEINNGNGIQFYPDKIEYTGNDNENLSPYNKVKFVYGFKTDYNRSFIAGTAMLNNRLISSIEVYNEQIKVKEYKLDYLFNKYSILNQIAEQYNNNNNFNPTVFGYNNIETSEFYTDNHTILPSNIEGAITNLSFLDFDYNSDGVSDIIKLYKQQGINKWELINKKNNQIFSGVLPQFNGIVETKNNGFASDFNGDGNQDFMIFFDNQISGSGNQTSLPKFYAMISNGINNFTLNEINFSNIPVNNWVIKYTVGDFDGDQATDLFVYFPDLNKVILYSIKKGEFFEANNFNFGNENTTLKVADFNGDGKNEILYINNNHSGTLEFNGSNIVETVNNLGFPTIYHKIYLSDFNGDGKTDILSWSDTFGWYISYSKGTILEFDSHNFYLMGNPNSNINNSFYEYIVRDLNGDGKCDIMVNLIEYTVQNNIYDEKIKESYCFFGLSYLFSNSLLLASNVPNMKPIRNLMPSDFHGFGACSFYTFIGSDINLVYSINFKNLALNSKLNVIRNGIGHQIDFNYNTLSRMDLTQQYIKNFEGVYPIWNTTFPLIVVNNVNIQNGLGSFNSFNYKYEGLKLHVSGKGLLGFNKFSEINLESKTRSEFEYTFNNNTYFQPTLLNAKVFSTIDNSMLTKSSYEYTFTNSLLSGNPGKRYSLYANEIKNFDYVNNNTVTATITQDESGNITQKITNNGIENITENFTYEKLCSNLPYNNRLITSQTIITRTGENPYQRSASFEYTDIACSMSKQTDDTGVEKLYQRNAFGNVISEGLTNPNVSTIYNSYEYDSKGRFITKSINALGHESLFEYEPIYGNVTKATDPNGLITSSTYDAFGRMKTTTSPTGIITDVSRLWEIDPTSKSIFAITQTTSGAPTERNFFSLTGDNVKNTIQGFDGNLITINKTYNKLGQILTESEPNSQLNTTYTYEPLLNRIQSINAPTGATTTYNYNENETQITSQQGQITSSFNEKYDATGKIIEASDNGGTVTYAYFSSGNPKTITSPGSVTVTMEYDNFGRQTKLIDPSAGITQYEYDALGRVTKQIDARGKYVEMTYDDLGRVISKEYSDGATIINEYDPENVKGMLKKTTLVQGTNDGFTSHITDYVYDNFTRLQEIKESFGDKIFSRHYQYDQLNRVSQETFPGGFVVNNQYNNLGYLSVIKDANQQNLWENISMNQRLQPEVSKYGSSLQVTHGYTNLGVLNQKQANNNINQLIWHQSYAFDAASGNLESRSNSLINTQENFTYDNLHRLKEVLDGNQQLKHETIYHHNNNGNIAYKSDAGEYIYSSSPFAIAALQNPQPDLATHQQDISYTGFNQPHEITENGLRLKYHYGPDEQRRISELYDAQENLIKKIYYNGNYEIIETNGNTYEVNYLFAPEGLYGIAVKENENPVQVYYLETDHLGSILGLYNGNGQAFYNQSFDAWGRERNPTDWSSPPFQGGAGGGSKPAWLIRGYTGHEHLPEFALINMNGRMYDPVLGRMLSPDNFVQDPSNTQSYNRYSYCWNNPLKYTDPDGEWVHIAIGAVIGGAINLGVKAYQGKIDSWGDGFAAFGIGAAAGALGAATGGAAFTAAGGAAGGAGGFIAGSAGGLAGTAFASPVQSIGNSLYFKDPFMTGKQFILGLGIGALTGGIVNGSIAVYYGRNFWNGNFPKHNLTSIQPIPAKPIQNENKNNLEIARQEIKQVPKDNNTYTLKLNQQNSPQPTDGRGIQIGPPRPEINGYHPSLAGKTDMYHNFPKELDRMIINNGAWSQRISDYVRYNNVGYWFELPGAINNANGIYQIGINGQGVIFHRFFSPF